MHIPALIVSIIFSAMSATAAEITITTSSHEDVQRSRIVYDCGGRGIPVEYINTGPVSLAVLEIDGETVVASNVFAASGAKYAGGPYVWWTKGDAADLYDVMKGGMEAEPVRCVSKG